MAVIKTIISIPSTGEQYSTPVAMTAAQVRVSYADALPAIANMTDTTTEEVTAEGTVRTITFAPRQGNKG